MQSQPIPSNVAGLSHHPRNRSPHAAGSATVLVVVVLVMLAMLGATYLQIARFERQSQSKQTGNIDAALDSVVALVKQRLKEDVVDKNDKVFNPTADNTTESDIDGDDEVRQTGADEPYDHPWTNPAADSLVHREPGDMDDLVSTAEGGKYDDMWLASSSPDFSNSTNGVWPHITNLNGVFLSNNQDGALLGHSVEPQQEASVARGTGNPWYRDSNVPITTNDFDVNADNYGNGTLVDADGDGIGDSKWQWAPLDQVGNTRYVMAVRIVDLASMLNANVAMSAQKVDEDRFTGFDTNSAGDKAPRGTTPSEWDLGGFVDHFGEDSHSNELLNLLDYRAGDKTVDDMPVPYGKRVDDGGSLPDRLPFWGETGRHPLTGLAAGGSNNTPSAGRHLTLGDEIELRFNNGLNRSATSIMEQEMGGGNASTFLHANNDGRVHYGQWTPNDGSAATVQNFFQKEPRKWLTVASGAVPYTPPISTDDTDGETRPNLNNASIPELRSVISDVYSTAGTKPGNPNVNFVDQFLANLIDYRDENNTITKMNNAHGLEALPFIAEVYIQGRYEITGSSSTGASSKEYTVELQGDLGFAIEIRNPFSKQIPLDDIQVRVGSQTLGTLTDAQANLGADQSLVIYHDSNGGATSDDNITDLIEGADATANVDWSWPADAPSATGTEVPTTNATVGLRAKIAENGNGEGSYQADTNYSATPFVKPASTYTINDNDTSNKPNYSNGATDYFQYTSIGNGNGLNVITVSMDEFAQPSPVHPKLEGDSAAQPELASPALDLLGERDKTGEGPANEMTRLNRQQLIVSDRGHFDHVAELAQIAVLGPRPESDQTVGDVWDQVNGNGAGGDSEPSRVADFLLRFNPQVPDNAQTDPLQAERVSSGTGDGQTNRNVPYAVMLMDQCTTLDVEDEFVPGKVNLNTASRTLLEAALPVANNAARTRIVDAILKARRDPSRAGGTDREGLAYVGETFWPLMDPDNNDADNDGDSLPGHDQDGGNAKDTRTLDNVRVDFQPEDDSLLPTPSGNGEAKDGIANDREERLMLINWFHQMASTRSDVFAAWIVVHGYPAGDFTANDADEDNQGEPVESARLLVLLDRSNVGSGGNVQVIDALRIY